MLIGADENGHDLADSYGVSLFKDHIIRGVGKFAAKVYHEYFMGAIKNTTAYRSCYLAAKERSKWALPGTEKTHSVQELGTSDVGNSRSTTAEPTSAVASRLKKNHISSLQPSRSNSVLPSTPKALPGLAKPTVFERNETSEPGDGVDGADVPDRAGSPASIATHDPEFDENNAASSPLPGGDGLEDWEMDDSLLPQERIEISRERSEYERSRAYNIVCNRKLAADLKDSVEGLFTQK